MRPSMNIPFYRLKPWIFSAILAAVQCMALYSTIPYFVEYSPGNSSDAKLGTFLVIWFTIFVYIIQLFIPTPLLIARLKELGHKFWTARDLGVFLPLLVGPGFLLLLYVNFPQHFLAFR